MKKINDKLVLFVGLLLVFALFAATFSFIAVSAKNNKNVNFSNIGINGIYSADGKKFTHYKSGQSFENNRYSTITVKGKLNGSVKKGEYVFVHINNVWIQIKANGKEIASNYAQKHQNSTNTPGYSLAKLSSEQISENSEIELKITNPYPLSSTDLFSNVLDRMITGPETSIYADMFQNNMFGIFIGLAISFLGLFSFTLAGGLFQNVKFQYLSFSLVAIFGGLYILTDTLYDYLPLLIPNPTLCMFFDESTVYFLSIASALYIRSNLKRKIAQKYMSAVIFLTMLITIAAFLLQLFGIQDILTSEIFLYIPLLAGFVGGMFFLVIGGFRYGNTDSKIVAISYCPMLVVSFIDILFSVLDIMPQRSIFHMAMLFTIVIQIIQLVLATKNSYDANINYEKMQKELLQSRVMIMVSQIQPHFLYNALTSIAQLCEKNPKLAKKATIDFADYLRGNMNSLKNNNPVPFETELSHLKTYLSLEKMRFGDELNIVYDINTTDFYIPSLSVQPLVENAVKHGVGMREDGGTVTISTEECEDCYKVIVKDDGVGFDTLQPPKDTTRTHIGMDNVKERISSMCGGNVLIESEIGKGTTATIIIPKENN